MQNLDNIIFLEEVDSTNNEIKRRLEKEILLDGLAVVSQKQTCGKGRMGRKWQTFAGDLAVSFWIPCVYSNPEGTLDSNCKFLSLSQDKILSLPLVASLAVLDLLNCLGVKNAQCKWPNDVLVNNKKISGILCEFASNDYEKQNDENRTGVIIGIGINLKATNKDLETLNRQATSCALSGAKTNSAFAEAGKLAKFLRTRVEKLRLEGFSAMSKEWYDSCCHKDQFVKITLNREDNNSPEQWAKKIECQGTACGIGTSGQLLIKTDKGDINEVWIGDVN